MSDCLIIGGGVLGAGLAWHLARRGHGARIIEAERIGAGASAGPGRRGVRANGRDVRELPLMAMARNLWPALHEDLGVAPLFQRSGGLLLIERDEDLAWAPARVALQNRFGTRSQWLDADALREREPDLAATIRGAIFCSDDGDADHSATTAAYAAAARRAGARIDEGIVARRLEHAGGRVIGIETSTGESVPVNDRLAILANPGVGDLIAPFVDPPLWNSCFQVLLSRPLPSVPVRHLIGHAHRALALKGEPGNRVMISGGRRGRWNPRTGRGEAVDEAIAANLADARAVYPALEGLEVEIADAGHRESLSLDGVPVIDTLPGLDNALYATGWCGHGWAIAPAVAGLLADWILDGERPALLAPFAHGRFGLQ